MSKAFNHVDHSILLKYLYNMHCPSWLLRIFYSFLSERTLILKYKSNISNQKSLPGGAPQGTLLGMIFFSIKFNSAMSRTPIRRLSLSPVSNYVKAKYFDDSSVAVSISLSKHLVNDIEGTQRPLKHSERTGQILPLPNNLLQMFLNDFQRFTVNNKMLINSSKSKVMKFSRSTAYDFPLEVTINEGQFLEEVSSIKLLGIMITNNLKWENNTDYICSKAKRKIWLLRNMKMSGFAESELLYAYKKEVRSLLELAVPVWGGAITQDQCHQIERIQKSALAAILGPIHTTYHDALTHTGLKKYQTEEMISV